MVSYSSAVSIKRSAAQIFPHLFETTTHTTRRDLTNGSAVEVSFGTGPIKAVVGLHISTLEFGHKLAFRSYSGPITWKGEYNLAEDGNGATTVSQKGELNFNGRWRLWQPFAGGQIRRGEVQELLRLKTLVEASPAVA
jgi:hypothetical protein